MSLAQGARRSDGYELWKYYHDCDLYNHNEIYPFHPDPAHILRRHTQLSEHIPRPQPHPILHRPLLTQPHRPQHPRRSRTSSCPLDARLPPRKHHQPVSPHEHPMRNEARVLGQTQRASRFGDQSRIRTLHFFSRHTPKPALKPMREESKRHTGSQPLIHEIRKCGRRPAKPLEVLMHPAAARCFAAVLEGASQ